MINKSKFKEVLIEAESGNEESIAVIREVLRPKAEDSIEAIQEKIEVFIRMIFLSSLRYKDAPYHKEIDKTYAEQIYSYLNYGKPKYKGVMIIGFRESAKTTRVKMNECYLTVYLSDIVDLTTIVSEDGSNADQINMDIYNTLAFSRIAIYYPNQIPISQKDKDQKETQRIGKFTTTTGVTFSASTARQSRRGTVKIDINDDGEVESKRPKKIIFDDIENENTIQSFTNTLRIRSVMNATIDGLDQLQGSWVLLGNYLSLRGNIHYFISKYKDNEDYKLILISILDHKGQPTWTDKYCATDKEQIELASQGIYKVSTESIRRESDNFETEYLNSPSRTTVYFDDKSIEAIESEYLIKESEREKNGLLILEEPDNTATYIIGVDCATGVGKDETAFTIIKTNGIRYEEVANFKSSKISPEDTAPLVAKMGRMYNMALVIPENNYPNNEFIAFLRQIYNYIFIEDDTYGVNTNMKSKKDMLLNFKQILINKLLNVKSQALYDQISEFPESEVMTVGRDSSGGHFDLLMSCTIALFKAQSISTNKYNNDILDTVINRSIDKAFKRKEFTK